MINTKVKFNGLSGKDLLSMVNDNCDPVTINGNNYLLTPRKFVATNRIEICSNDLADAVEVRDRFDHVTLIKI